MNQGATSLLAPPLNGATVVAEPTRERILRLADDLFAVHGYARVSMREVADAAGVTKPALYYHFRDKDALFEECVRLAQRRLAALISAAARQAPLLRDRVLGIAQAMIAGSRHHPVRMMADVGEHLSVDVQRRLWQEFDESIVGPIMALFTQARTRGESRPEVTPETATACLVGLCYAFLPVTVSEGVPAHPCRSQISLALPADRAAAVVADLALHGVAS